MVWLGMVDGNPETLGVRLYGSTHRLEDQSLGRRSVLGWDVNQDSDHHRAHDGQRLRATFLDDFFAAFLVAFGFAKGPYSPRLIAA